MAEPGFVPGAVGKATGEYSAASQNSKPTDLPFKETPSGGNQLTFLIQKENAALIN